MPARQGCRVASLPKPFGKGVTDSGFRIQVGRGKPHTPEFCSLTHFSMYINTLITTEDRPHIWMIELGHF
jgi:hypothetical protein